MVWHEIVSEKLTDSRHQRNRWNWQWLTLFRMVANRKLQQRSKIISVEKKWKLFPTRNAVDKETTSKGRSWAKKTEDGEIWSKCKKVASKPKMTENSEDCCMICKVVYGDKADQKCNEDWLKCSVFAHWFHDSCAQSYGVVDDDETFTLNCV